MTDWNRRAVLTTGVAAGVLASDARAHGIGIGLQGEKSMTGSANRIDVHQHLLPPEFLAALDRHGISAWAPAKWSVEGALAMMDEHQIATGILSLSTPGPHLGDNAEGRVLTRQVNERQAALVQSRPDRFGMFACVPLPDVDGALEAIRHAYDHLATDGVILLANSAGIYAGDPAFDPVMEELNRRNAVVFIHPGRPPRAFIPLSPTSCWIQRARRSIWFRTAFRAASRSCASSFRTRAASCPTPPIASPICRT